MEEKLLSPLEMKLTYIHDTATPVFKETWDWLEKIVQEDHLSEIPSIVVVEDPQKDPQNQNNPQYFIYNGNKRVRHATQHNYPLPAIVIKNQQDLDQYLSKNNAAWFNITNFSELLEVMHIYSAHPRYDDVDPSLKSLQDKIQEKRRSQHEARFNALRGGFSEED